MSDPKTVAGSDAASVHEKIKLLIHSLVHITDKTGGFLQRLPDGRVVDTKGWNGWEWTHGIGLYGLYQYHSLTGSTAPLQIIEEWFAARLQEGTTKNINTMAALLTLAYVYEETRQRSYLPWLESWAEWAMYDLPRTRFGGMQHITYSDENRGQLWDDTLMMTVLPLAKVGKLLNRPHYVEEATRQFLLHIQYLFDKSTGLFFHGWEFNESATGGIGHNFANARWARGNSWLTIAIPDYIELLDLPPGDPIRGYLISVLEAQCCALKKLQTPEGLWRTLLDVSESEGSYAESSATAGFAYGLLKAVRKRYISPDFATVGIKAVHAVVRKINADGELTDVSFGTAMGHSLEFYLQIPKTSMPYGQAMAIMALGEFLRTFI